MAFALEKFTNYMYHFRRTANGICSFFIVKTRKAVRIIGILITKKKKILFMHQREESGFKTILVIQNRGCQIALGRRD
ncbi:hypothetical protein [Candidatus Nitrosotenuis cloacae]|uniref:hypothetical protein n=1 Tax=Candidatus Nitrosotenuis cloacae TaxID=1603555 RepID=UPI00227E6EAD|nr:hypothetical protein [Candidatus Nitrosotenuis cloacae]